MSTVWTNMQDVRQDRKYKQENIFFDNHYFIHFTIGETRMGLIVHFYSYQNVRLLHKEDMFSFT